jgi:folate-binding protein YgfZ
MRPVALRQRLLERGAQFASSRGWEVVQHFGDRDAEWEALRSGAAVQDRAGHALVRLTGPDRATFLHGQTTNEVNGLAIGAANEAVLLTNRGKMLAEVVVLKRAEDIWLRGEIGFGPELLAALQRNCVSEEVEFEDLSERVAQLGLYGPRAAELLGRAAGATPALTALAHREVSIGGHSVTVLALASFGVPGFELFVESPQAVEVWDALLAQGARPFGEAALELARISSGIPRYGVDMTEDTNPLEANLERAISYQKGCYVGQEVIAKATFRGHVNRKLIGLRFASEAAPPPSELQLEGRVVGRTTSSVRRPDGVTIGLGFVKRDLAKPGVALAMPDGTTATTVLLPLESAAP